MLAHLKKESVFWPHLGNDFLELEGDAGLHDARVLADRVGNPLLHTQTQRLLVGFG